MNPFNQKSASFTFGFLFLALVLSVPPAFSNETTQKPVQGLMKLEGEILEVEELKEPRGSAIYTVKDLSTGRTLRLFLDPYRSLVRMGAETKSATDVLGGSKVTIIYRDRPDREMPEIVFAKVAGSYYS